MGIRGKLSKYLENFTLKNAIEIIFFSVIIMILVLFIGFLIVFFSSGFYFIFEIQLTSQISVSPQMESVELFRFLPALLALFASLFIPIFILFVKSEKESIKKEEEEEEKHKLACIILLEEFEENKIKLEYLNQDQFQIINKFRVKEWDAIKTSGLTNKLGSFNKIKEFFEYYQRIRMFNHYLDARAKGLLDKYIQHEFHNYPIKEKLKEIENELLKLKEYLMNEIKG